MRQIALRGSAETEKRAACRAGRVLFLRDGEVYHQLYRGELTEEEMWGRISDALTLATSHGEEDAG